MDEEWVKEVGFFFSFLFSFGSTDVLKQTQSPYPENSSSLGKMAGDGFGELELKNALAKK